MDFYVFVGLIANKEDNLKKCLWTCISLPFC